jgi:hypothetical protein
MNIPGFTAIALFNRSSGQFQNFSLIQTVRSNVNSIQPALSIYSGGRFICDGKVTEFGFIECQPLPRSGGPRESFMRCGQCKNGEKTCRVPGEGSFKLDC